MPQVENPCTCTRTSPAKTLRLYHGPAFSLSSQQSIGFTICIWVWILGLLTLDDCYIFRLLTVFETGLTLLMFRCLETPTENMNLGYVAYIVMFLGTCGARCSLM